MKLQIIAPLVLLCAACAHMKHNVDQSMILPQASQVYPEDEHHVLIPPGVLDNPSPAYPALPKGFKPRDTLICIDLTVGDGGDVTQVHQITPEPECEPVDSAASAIFYAAVAGTVSKWEHFAAQVCTYDRSKDECEGDSANLRPVAVHLAFRFSFTQVNGKGVIKQN